jgi:catechol 2,3-dioxygenase-like lactoylglutathione lyase family enzyme
MRQADWYCKHLGLKLVFHNGQEPPSVLLGYEGQMAMIELMPVKHEGPQPGSVPRLQPGWRHVALRVSDFEEAYGQLKKLGVEFLFEPVPSVGGGTIVSFRDPEGNELQIVERDAKTT